MTPPPDDIHADIRARLRGLQVDPPAPADFQARLHQRLVAAGPPEAPGLWRRLVDGGSTKRLVPAFGLVAATVLVTLWMTRSVVPVAPSGVEVPVSKVAVVHVDLKAAVAVESADIQITLPPGLAFWSDGEELAERSFTWSQPLAAGSNEIPIAVRGKEPGLYRLTVSAHIGGQDVQHDVLLEVIEG
jgi:hypothetical protein